MRRLFFPLPSRSSFSTAAALAQRPTVTPPAATHKGSNHDPLDPTSICALLRSCRAAKSEGGALHALAIACGLSRLAIVSNHLVHMYGRGGLLVDARQVFGEMPVRNLFSWNTLIGCCCKAGMVDDARKLFDEMPHRDQVSWNAMISGYDRHGPREEALVMFCRMRHSGFSADCFGVSSAISACSSLRSLVNGEEIHGLSVKLGLDLDVHVGSALVELYGKCMKVDNGRRVFDGMAIREQFTWNSMLSSYVHCARVDDAVGFLSEIPEKNLVSWTTMVVGCSQHGCNEEAIGFYYKMLESGFKLDEVSIVGVLTACAGLQDVDEGCKIHGLVVKNGFENNDVIGSVLVAFYAKCGRFFEANRVADGMDFVDEFSWSLLIAEFAKQGHIENACVLFEGLGAKSLPLWNALITGYSEVGLHEEAFQSFKDMSVDGIVGDEFTFACLLKGSDLFGLSYGKQFHSEVTKIGLDTSNYVGSAIIDMYCHFADCAAAKHAFCFIKKPNIVSWNALISGYAQNDHVDALDTFQSLHSSSVEPDKTTISCVIDVCSNLLLSTSGMQVHGIALKIGLESDVVVGTAIINMYGKFGKVEHASLAFFEIHWHNVVSWTSLLGAYVRCGMWNSAIETFNMMPEKNIISWNTMLTGYARQGSGMEALRLYQEMNKRGIFPDHITFVNLLNVCCNLCLEEGKQVHGQIIKTGFSLNMHVIAALINMYGRLGEGEESSPGGLHDAVCALSLLQK